VGRPGHRGRGLAAADQPGPAGCPRSPGLPPGRDRAVALPVPARRRARAGLRGLADLLPDDTPDELVDQFCRALLAKRDAIVWDIGGVQQPPLPLERMVRDSPVTPLDVPLHTRAAAVWAEQGYLP
jgi:hypothetical protein